MRNTVLIALFITIAALIVCVLKVRKSDVKIARSVEHFILTLIPPVLGNIIIIASTTKAAAEVGCYIYFIGMDLVAAFLLSFTLDFCNLKWVNKKSISAAYTLFSIDIVQMLLNHVFRHAFDTYPVTVDGRPYYHLAPYYGQTFHRVVVYGFFVASIALFAIKVIRTSSVYNEKYKLILVTMILTGAWETYYIVSGTPVDTSMIGFGVFGLLVSYFTIYYSPSHLIASMLSSIASELPEALFFFNEERNCIWVNDEGRRLLKLGTSNPDNVRDMLVRFFPELEKAGEEWSVQRTTGSGDNKKYYYIEKHIAWDRGREGRRIGSFVRVLDNTEAQLNLERERYNASHDSLTGLYNKDHLFKRIRDKLTANPDVPYQVAFVDVNEFKLVNDVFGKDFGDYALQQIGKWITSVAPEGAIYGRLGGDTFGVFEPTVCFDPEKIDNSLQNFVVKQGDKEHHVLIHVGVYQIDDRDLDVSVMFDRARMALSKIKRVYAHVAYYNDSIREDILWSQKISAELKTAIEERQIKPYFQPIVNSEGKVVGAEALTRWQHPEKGLLSPAAFIPEFEQNGKIIDIDKYMWRCACEQLKSWETTNPDLFISVNISPVDFYYMDVRQEINRLTEQYGVDRHKMRLEITEAVMMSNLADRIQTLNWLKKDGFVVEMDDFGSGYSSLNMLKDMPVDLIKLDMEFLHDSMFNDKAKTILNSIVNLIEMLGMDSLVEGVETREQFEMLSSMGCMYFQGYYFAKPLPIREFEEYCRTA